MKDMNIEESLDRLGINEYTYEYKPVSRRGDFASVTSEADDNDSDNDNDGVIFPFPQEQKSNMIRLFILFSFGLGFYFRVGPMDFSNVNISIHKPTSSVSSVPGLDLDQPEPIRAYQQETMVELLGELSQQKSLQESSMKQMFGPEFYGLLFENPELMDKLFVMDAHSKERLLRRLMIKVLEAQFPQSKSKSNINSKFGLNKKGKSEPSHIERATSSTFIWATGGDSGAAGHGNLFKQSYTKVMEDTVKGAFKAIGIDFQGRNYGMGGYSSGPELALCMEAIYGTDLDILVWDFASAEEVYKHWYGDENEAASWKDSDMSYKASLWAHRAGIHPTKPILFMMDSGTKSIRVKKVQNLVDRGMGLVLMDSDGMAVVKSILPITTTVNPTQEEILYKESLPPNLQYIRCENDAIEGSVPCDDPKSYLMCDDQEASVCREHKFDTHEICTNARHQRSYNPGW